MKGQRSGLQVDVEGYEWPIIEGAYQALSTGRLVPDVFKAFKPSRRGRQVCFSWQLRVGLLIIEYGDKWSFDTSEASFSLVGFQAVVQGDILECPQSIVIAKEFAEAALKFRSAFHHATLH